MVLWEVWVYGEGRTGRLRFQAPDEHTATEKFLNRHVLGAAGYMQFSDVLHRRGEHRVKVCVKDPAKTGTRQSPNYPTVYTFTYTEEEEWVVDNISTQ